MMTFFLPNRLIHACNHSCLYENFFACFSDRSCCSEIRVTINAGIQGGRSGIYYKANGLVNGKNHWTLDVETADTDGQHAIRSLWYDIKGNGWVIGRSLNFGSSWVFGIKSVEDAPCPTTSGNTFKYYSAKGHRWNVAPVDSISIQCA